MDYEYCVMHVSYSDEPHRGPWSAEECRAWIKAGEEIGVKPGTFYVVCREVGPWFRA